MRCITIFIPTKDKINSLQIHFIVACYFAERKKVKHYVERAIRSCENFLNDYQSNKEVETRDDLSVGEDLETYIQRVVNGEITREMIPKHGELKGNFLICLLDKKERWKLDRKNEKFLISFWDNESGEADIPLEEWNKSKSNLKFSSSVSWRATYLIELSESEISLLESNRSRMEISNIERNSSALANSARSPQASQVGRRLTKPLKVSFDTKI